MVEAKRSIGAYFHAFGEGLPPKHRFPAFLEVSDQTCRVCFEPEVMKRPSQPSIHSEQMRIREYLNASRAWDSSGIDFQAATTILKGDGVRQKSDREGEFRWTFTGKHSGKLWTVVYTIRGENTRIISVRRARKNEERDYHQEIL